MNKNIDKDIALYFDEDFLKIIYKDLKLNNHPEVEQLLKNENKKILNDDEIHKFQLFNYQLGSIGKTSRILKEKNIEFAETKLLSNDYLGDEPSYRIASVKIIFRPKDEVVIGFQIANEKNIDSRLNFMKNIIAQEKKLKDIANAKIFQNMSENDLDILNICALMAMNYNSGKENIKEIDAIKIEELINNKEFLLDVRENYEYVAGHIKGAKNIAMSELMQKITEIPKDKNVYVYCRSGHRSADAVSFLNSLGYENVYNVRGGFIEISFNEFYKDKGNLEKSILTNYNFE